LKSVSKSLPILFVFLVFLFFPVSAFSGDKEEGKFVPGELLVKFRTQVSKRGATSVHGRIKAHRTKRFHIVKNLEHIKLPPHMTVEDALRFYKGLPEVEYAEPNYIKKPFATTPNDTYFNDLWGLNNTGQTGGTADADIDAPEAWDIQSGTSNIIVAVLDTGADLDHEDLADNIWINAGEIPGNSIDDDGNDKVDDVRGWDFKNDDNDPDDETSHGTHVSGTIGARGNNNKGITGVCWTVSLMTVRMMDGSGGTTAQEIAAIQYAVDMGARIINASFGSYDDPPPQSEYDAIQSANASGVLFVAAAGNAGLDIDSGTTKCYPASYDLPNIIAVAASDHNDGLLGGSNYGATTVDVAAPGNYIYSTFPGDNYGYMGQTSTATPHVSGLAALIWSNNPALTHLLVKKIILDNVDQLPSMDGKVLTGGRINAFKALSDIYISSDPDGKGDINDDGFLSQADVDIALQVLAGKSPEGIRSDYASSDADVNGDDKIGMEELIYIKEKLGGLRD
jgi:large repetitive protein